MRVTALLLAVILAVGGIVLKICGCDAQTDFEPTLSLDTGLSSEQAQKDLKYVYDTVRAKHPVFLIDDGAEKRFGDVYIKLRRELMDKDSVTVKELWEKSAELVCTLDDAHTIVTVSGTEYVNGGIEISTAYKNGTLLSIDGISADSMKEHFKKVFPCEPQVSFYADYMFGEVWSTAAGLRFSVRMYPTG